MLRPFLLSFLVVFCWLALVSPSTADAAAFTARIPFGTPTITDDAEGTLIETTSPPSSGEGVYYRASLDPNRVYRVTVQGERVEGAFNLRVSQAGDREWYAAPDGVDTWRVTNARDVELLFYRAEEAKYRIRVLRIEDCTATCTTDSGLKNHILAEAPGLASAVAAGDRHTAAKAILGWVAPRVTFARGGGTLPMDSYQRGASELYYDFFAVNRGGVFCGGAADFYKKVLALFGIPSFPVLFGDDSGDLRHVTVLVPFSDGQGGTDYRIFDPSFNFDLLLPASGHSPTVAEFFELWRAGMMDRVQYREESLGQRRLISNRMPDGSYSSSIRCSDQPNSTACSLDAFLRGFAPSLTKHGFETGLGAYPQLLGTSNIYSGDLFLAPGDFQNTQATFRGAVRSGSNAHVALLPIPPFVDRGSSIEGNPAVGHQLEARLGWSPRAKVSSQSPYWSRCDAAGEQCEPIAGANGHTYAPTAADVGHRLRVTSVASNEYGASGSATAATPSAIAAAPDLDAPGVTLTVGKKQKLSDFLRRGLRVRAACSEGCQLSGGLAISRDTAKKEGLKPAIGRPTVSQAPTGVKTLVVKPTARARTKLADARSLRVTVQIHATDGSGNNSPTASKVVRLFR